MAAVHRSKFGSLTYFAISAVCIFGVTGPDFRVDLLLHLKWFCHQGAALLGGNSRENQNLLEDPLLPSVLGTL